MHATFAHINLTARRSRDAYGGELKVIQNTTH